MHKYPILAFFFKCLALLSIQVVAYFVCQLFGAGQVSLLCVYKRSVDWRGAAELVLIICGFIAASNTFTCHMTDHSPSDTWADDKIHVTPSQADATNMNLAELISNPFMNAEFGQINSCYGPTQTVSNLYVCHHNGITRVISFSFNEAVKMSSQSSLMTHWTCICTDPDLCLYFLIFFAVIETFLDVSPQPITAHRVQGQDSI